MMIAPASAPAQPAAPRTERLPLPLPRPASSFYEQARAAGTLASQAQDLIVHDWHSGHDTQAARDAIAAALQSAASATGEPAPAPAVAAARDGEAFLRHALASMRHLRTDVPPEVARPFVSAAVTALDLALREYSAGLQPTPAYI